jgi:hypothetical protein
MEFKVDDCEIDTFPLKKGTWVQAPNNGVKLLHKPSGIRFICSKHGNVHQNMVEAKAELEKLVTAYTPPDARARFEQALGELIDERVAAAVAEQLPDAIHAALVKYNLL